MPTKKEGLFDVSTPKTNEVKNPPPILKDKDKPKPPKPEKKVSWDETTKTKSASGHSSTEDLRLGHEKEELIFEIDDI
jgi:hypothetical protein